MDPPRSPRSWTLRRTTLAAIANTVIWYIGFWIHVAFHSKICLHRSQCCSRGPYGQPRPFPDGNEELVSGLRVLNIARFPSFIHFKFHQYPALDEHNYVNGLYHHLLPICLHAHLPSITPQCTSFTITKMFTHSFIHAATVALTLLTATQAAPASSVYPPCFTRG